MQQGAAALPKKGPRNQSFLLPGGDERKGEGERERFDIAGRCFSTLTGRAKREFQKQRVREVRRDSTKLE